MSLLEWAWLGQRRLGGGNVTAIPGIRPGVHTQKQFFTEPGENQKLRAIPIYFHNEPTPAVSERASPQK